MKTLNAKFQSLKFLWTNCIVVRIFQFNAAVRLKVRVETIISVDWALF